MTLNYDTSLQTLLLSLLSPSPTLAPNVDKLNNGGLKQAPNWTGMSPAFVIRNLSHLIYLSRRHQASREICFPRRACYRTRICHRSYNSDNQSCRLLLFENASKNPTKLLNLMRKVTKSRVKSRHIHHLLRNIQSILPTNTVLRFTSNF
jgi:hypothetical protein